MVMTTDFLITDADGKLHARTVKPSEDFNKRRTIEKLEIERLYWQSRGISWGIVTEKEINTTLTDNIQWVSSRASSESLSPLNIKDIRNIKTHLSSLFRDRKLLSLRDICNESDDTLGYSKGSSLSVVRHLLAKKEWKTDMRSQVIQPSSPTSIISGDDIETTHKSAS